MQPVIYDELDIPVSSGDIIFAYTDGGARNSKSRGRVIGLENLLETLQRQESTDPYQIKQNVLDALTGFSTASLIHDDVTFMAVK